MTWDVVLRSLNILGCAISLWYLATAAFRQWTSYNDKTKEHWWAFTGWVLLGFEGGIESLVLGAPPGPRIVLQSLVVAFTLRSLTRQGDVQSHSVKPWKKED